MAGGEEEGRRGGVEKDDKECTHGNDSEVMSPAFLNIFNNEYWNRVYEARMGWRKRVRLAGESAERGLLVLVVVEGDEGRRRGSFL